MRLSDKKELDYFIRENLCISCTKVVCYNFCSIFFLKRFVSDPRRNYGAHNLSVTLHPRRKIYKKEVSLLVTKTKYIYSTFWITYLYNFKWSPPKSVFAPTSLLNRWRGFFFGWPSLTFFFWRSRSTFLVSLTVFP